MVEDGGDEFGGEELAEYEGGVVDVMSRGGLRLGDGGWSALLS